MPLESRCTRVSDTIIPDAELILFPARKLRGQSVLCYFHWVETRLKTPHFLRRLEVSSHGPVQGRNLCARPCAGILEALQFNVMGDSFGKWFRVGLSVNLG